MTSETNKLKPDLKNLLKGYNMLLYFCGSLVMYEPTEECVTDFFSNGILKRLPVFSTNPKFTKAASLLRESCPGNDQCHSDLIMDYQRLFASDGFKLAEPVESVYIKNLKAQFRVYEFYDSYGWKSRFADKVPDEHLGIELLFLTKLIDKYLQLDDMPCCIEMKKEIHRFIEQHIIAWLPEWNQKVQENSMTLCYKGVGNMLVACVEDLFEIFDDQGQRIQEIKNWD